MIGPWLHGGDGTTPVGQMVFPSATDPRAQEYYAKWQKGVFQDDWDDWAALPAVRVYHMGAPAGTEWRSYPTWPPPAIEYPLYLYHNGRPGPGNGSLLSGVIPRAGQVSFTSDPDNPCPTLGGTNNLVSCVPELRPDGTCGPYDQRQIEGRDGRDVLVFTSGTSGAWIVGRIHADVWIQTELPDVDVFVRVTDVYPNGKSMLIAQGIQRARYRNATCPDLLNGDPVLVRVDLWSTALVIPVGHRIRVIVSASAGASLNSPPGTSPLYEINPQNGDEYIGAHPNRTGTINVLFGGQYASALYIPVPTGQTLPPDRRPNTHPCAP